MTYRDARTAGIEAWRRPQVGSFEVGDIVKPGDRSNYPYKYDTLNYQSEYVVEAIAVSQSKTKHQLLKLNVSTAGKGHISPYHDGHTASTYYDARNIKFVRKGDGMVTSEGQLKKNVAWIIVNEADNRVVTSIPLTDPPGSNEADQPSEQTHVAYPTDAVRGTADFISRSQGSEIDSALYTEKLVDEKISELLRKNPEATFMAFKHVKSGQLPVLPVRWTTP